MQSVSCLYNTKTKSYIYIYIYMGMRLSLSLSIYIYIYIYIYMFSLFWTTILSFFISICLLFCREVQRFDPM